jgi:hypothetical protein
MTFCSGWRVETRTLSAGRKTLGTPPLGILDQLDCCFTCQKKKRYGEKEVVANISQHPVRDGAER